MEDKITSETTITHRNGFSNLWHKDKSVMIILAMVVIAASVILINVFQGYNNQVKVVDQNERIIKDIDANTVFLKDAMKDVGNAQLQREVATLIKQNTVEIANLKTILNETNEKLENITMHRK